MDTSHYFIDGFSSRKGLLGVLAFPNRLEGKNMAFTTFYTVGDDGEWVHEPFDFDIRSLTYKGSKDTGDWWLLGKRGEVARVGDDITLETINGAGTGPGQYGYLNHIAIINDKLYACGFRRQVYVRDSKGWKRMDRDMLEPLSARGSTLECIDGIDENCMYTVGNGGQIWHFDGRKWKQCACPVKVDLHAVQCVNRDKVMIVGQEETLLIGSGDEWEVVTRENGNDDLWSVEYFKETIYVAGASGIRKLIDGRLLPVLDCSGKVVLGQKLSAKEGLLWSIGTSNVYLFDGDKWTEIVCPDNEV